MHGEHADVIDPDEPEACREFAGPCARNSTEKAAAAGLWISLRTWLCSAAAIFVVSLTGNSSFAGELPTHFGHGARVADWQGDLMQWSREGIANLSSFVTASYSDAPALVLGLSAAAVLPLLVLAGLVLRRSQLVLESGRTMKYPAARKVPSANLPSQTHKLPVVGEASVSWQEQNSSTLKEHRFNGALMMRIGREDDNDVQLGEPTVHRYHAVISRSAESGFVVSDLSSADGNGVIVNGTRVRRQRLNDGDVITLGAMKLTFRLH